MTIPPSLFRGRVAQVDDQDKPLTLSEALAGLQDDAPDPELVRILRIDLRWAFLEGAELVLERLQNGVSVHEIRAEIQQVWNPPRTRRHRRRLTE